MASTQPKLVVVAEEEEEAFQPVSPATEYVNSSVLSLSILGVFESEIPIDDFPAVTALRNKFLPINIRFSSILVKGHNGAQQWKRVKIELEDHIKVPIFPKGLSPDQYDEYLHEYLATIAMDRLPQSRPLWEFHMIMYPTSNAAGTIVFKLHHALGDGFSLMGALFSCLTRADDPSLPLTFPSSKSSTSQRGTRIFKNLYKIFSGCWNTTYDFTWSVLRSTIVEDDLSAIRSGMPGVEFQPISISTVTFSLNRIRQVKSKVGGTVNDVITGVTFYGIQLYMQRMNQISRGKRLTSLVLLNTRMLNGYQNVQDMLTANSWGNHFTFLQVSIPSCSDVEKENPLAFVFRAKKMVRRKKNSMVVYLTGKLLQLMWKIRGREAASRYVHSTIKNSSTAISNLIGPVEKMAMEDHPIKNFYFSVAGVPQSLSLTMVSYIGNLTVAVTVEKGFIASQVLISCMKEAFEKIYEEACGKTEMEFS
ncbi:wax ester synthase/diacylglycerol acyltransferase 4-like [Tasmannia lanceolata]|uniref:wax ester synthase/diacylglycerol acyltransferase 4-like n=1 Tax=Tasmannia lanceolata TaxID=3420 RepID=UPI00406285D0